LSWIAALASMIGFIEMKGGPIGHSGASRSPFSTRSAAAGHGATDTRSGAAMGTSKGSV